MSVNSAARRRLRNWLRVRVEYVARSDGAVNPPDPNQRLQNDTGAGTRFGGEELTIQDEYDALDRLPSVVKDALNYSPARLSAAECQLLLLRRSPESVAAIIRKQKP